jgi:hypothetical protein
MAQFVVIVNLQRAFQNAGFPEEPSPGKLSWSQIHHRPIYSFCSVKATAVHLMAKTLR